MEYGSKSCWLAGGVCHVICLAPDCLSLDMISCQAGCRFCKSCLISTTEGVLARDMGVVICVGSCHLEMEVNQMQRVLEPNILSKLGVSRQAVELTVAGLENLVGCPYCPYQTIMDNLEDKVVSQP